MEDSAVEISVKAVDKASATLHKIEKELANMGGVAGRVASPITFLTNLMAGGWTSVGTILNTVVGALSMVGRVAGAVFGAMISVVEKVIGTVIQLGTRVLMVAAAIGGALATAMGGIVYKASLLAGAMEQSRMAFTTMLGSAGLARGFLKTLQDFAANTPFEFKDLVPASQRMMAFGFQAKQVIPTLTAIGDAVSGMGGSPEVLNRIILAFGQIKSKGKFQGQEAMQLSEAGINGYRMIAEYLGITLPETMKRGEAGLLDSTMAITAMVAGMEKQFGGMMAVQAKTMLGSWSNLMDSINAGLTTIGEPITKALTPVIQGITGMITSLSKSGMLTKIGETIAGWFSPERVGRMIDFFANIYRLGGLAVNYVWERFQAFIGWVTNDGVGGIKMFFMRLVDYLVQTLDYVKASFLAFIDSPGMKVIRFLLKTQGMAAGFGPDFWGIGKAMPVMPKWGQTGTAALGASDFMNSVVPAFKLAFGGKSDIGSQFAAAMKNAMVPVEKATAKTAEMTAQTATNTAPALDGKLYGGGAQSKLAAQRFLFGGAAAPIRVHIDIPNGNERDRMIAQAAAESVLAALTGKKTVGRQPTFTGAGVNGATP